MANYTSHHTFCILKRAGNEVVMEKIKKVSYRTTAQMREKTEKRQKPRPAFSIPRLTLVFILIILLITAISGCGQKSTRRHSKTSIMCSVFPQYDWTLQILGDKAGKFEVSLLQSNRLDLHNFHPTIDNILDISECDLFIYVGGASDQWARDTLRGATNEEMIVVNLLETLGAAAKVEEIVEGMEDDDDDDDDDEPEYDEHVWLSLKNAELFCKAIADAVSRLDPENSGVYKENLDAYTAKLSALDTQYQNTTAAAPIKTLLFGDRFPFRYLVDDYNLSYYAAFPGCSAETEASFKTIVSLAELVDELSLHTVMVTESGDQSIAKTIIDNTTAKTQQIVVLDAIQSITLDDLNAGVTYLSIMEKNLNALKEALK